MLGNKKQLIKNELFLRSRKINVSFVYTTHTYFPVLKNDKKTNPKTKTKFSHYFIMKIPNKRASTNRNQSFI